MNAKALSAVIIPVLIGAGYFVWPKTAAPHPQTAPPAATAAKPAIPAPSGAIVAEPAPAGRAAEVTELMAAIESGALKVQCTGNGRDRMELQLTNRNRTPLAIKVPVGQSFESDRNAVVVVRPDGADVKPGGTARVTVQTAATRSLNRVGAASYKPTYLTVPRIELFLTFVQDHPELTPGAIQTAVLALTENLTVSSIAKFTPAGGALPSRFNTDAFRVETVDIIQALGALRDIGVKERDLAMTIDPQLKIEAMIEPLCRAAAIRYYGIEQENEWEYWRNELLNGDPSTRHYALYGIARFYPDIALEMLPRWVREDKTNPVYRVSAIQALADTQRPEALALLQQLATDLGADTELGKAAAGAARYLDTHLTTLASSRTSVAFRASRDREF